MKQKVGLLFLACLLFAALNAKAAGTVNIVRVYVDCTGEDMVGARVCSSVKEKIRASKGFQLVSLAKAEEARASFVVHIVSQNDTGTDLNYASALSVTLTLPTPQRYEIYVTSIVMVVGTSKVDEIADSLISTLDDYGQKFGYE